MKGLASFLRYYGGKRRMAPYYPPPRHDTVIEPFAGGAGYSLFHFRKRVVLYETDPVVAGIWAYLIRVSPDEIRSIPLLGPDETTDDLHVAEEARHLVGFWLGANDWAPRKRLSAWGRQRKQPNSTFWGHMIRERIARQVECIRHWRIVHESYDRAPNVAATWFVDPPYQIAGTHYRHGSRGIDYDALSAWCQSRHGDVIVCENAGASWLPFRSMGKFQSASNRYSYEVIWTSAPHRQQELF